jgi:hypothetical protein
VFFVVVEQRDRDAGRSRLGHLLLDGGANVAENRHETDATLRAAQASGKGSE